MTITATFEDGVLKPDVPLELPEHSQVRITVEPVDAIGNTKRNTQEEWDTKKEARLAALEKSLKLAKPLGEHLTRDQLHERR